MATVTVPNRPFSTELITGLMLPDGIFESSLGRQRINAHFRNVGGAPEANVSVYIEGISHPGIAVTPQTHVIASLNPNAARVLAWEADFSAAPPGIHFVSFIEESATGRNRTIKKIFVTRTQFDATTKTATMETPQGVMSVRFNNMIGPKDICCPPSREENNNDGDIIKNLARFKGLDPAFALCLSTYLPTDMDVTVTLTPPYGGQYGELPFEDPWWKIALCILALLLLIAAAIAEATSGSGSVGVTTGGSTPPGCPTSTCGVGASGGGTSYLAAGLVAAAAAAATAAGLSDIRDPFRRGQDNTAPGAGELTVSEQLSALLIYADPVALGRPFKVNTSWKYTRNTTANNYNFQVDETNANVHVLSRYVIDAPEVVHFYKNELLIICAEFFGPDDIQYRGSDLFVQCFLIGPHGESYRMTLQDDGIYPDKEANDGVYCAVFDFAQVRDPNGKVGDPRGTWLYFVIAQDMNTAQPDMKPEEAAQIIGGMVLTHQLTIDFNAGTCPLVPDGHVNVI